MKKITKLLLSLTVCITLTVMFSSCEALFNMLMSEPEYLYIADGLKSISNTPITVSIYKIDSNYKKTGDTVIEDEIVFFGKNKTASINIYGKVTAGNYYEIVLDEYDSGSKEVNYYTGDPNISRKSSRCYFKAELGYNYCLSLAELTKDDVYFQLEKESK